MKRLWAKLAKFFAHLAQKHGQCFKAIVLVGNGRFTQEFSEYSLAEAWILTQFNRLKNANPDADIIISLFDLSVDENKTSNIVLQRERISGHENYIVCAQYAF